MVHWHIPWQLSPKKYSEDSTRAYCIVERTSCLIGVLRDERLRASTYQDADPNRRGIEQAVFTEAALCTFRWDDRA
jgi:hypothetical protein